ncbi:MULTISPECIES: hypothetical protein [Roseomonadaceae]|uniref:Uncharacterized protein n=1 Tax=Falsiroseomonas oleicola TaxID=2801474 RepID=A0ABS6H8G9_9PROT|nr:hypothetical protein [Roseomonas oleicola]MBU8544013.1 hypothetical protein [Roseomonas oleicola]
MNPHGRSLLAAAALLALAQPLHDFATPQIGPGERKAPGGRILPAPQAPPPPPRDDTWTAKRKAKARAKRGRNW